MNKFLIIFLFLEGLLYSQTPKIHLTKSKEGNWYVQYRLDKPTSKLVFMFNPDNSRQKRWTPTSDEVKIIYQDKKEMIVRKDGSNFSLVNFQLTPHYIAFEAYNPPFARFSDGGIIFNDGRFFACSNQCEPQSSRTWNIELSAPKDDHIIIGNSLSKKQANWTSQGEGKFIYVGKQKSINDDHIIMLLDPELPKTLSDSLSNMPPHILNFFNRKLGQLATKPTVFASIEKFEGKGLSFSQKGSVLKGSIVMHWFTNDFSRAIKKRDNFEFDTIWFIAHELAHLYQHTPSKGAFGSQYAWIHEGSAELFTLLALKSLLPKQKSLIKNKIEKYKEDCKKVIQKSSLSKNSESNHFMANYFCGILLNYSIHELIKKVHPKSNGIWDVWKSFKEKRKTIDQDQAIYLETIRTYLDKNAMSTIESFIYDSKKNYHLILKNLPIEG